MDLQPLTVDQIREQMRGIRRDLRANVKDIVVGASQMFDWKSYVRSFPLTTVATAAVLGYLLVPRRQAPTASPRETKNSIDNLAKEIKAVIAPPPPSFSLVSTILPVLGGVALRLGTSYLMQLGTGLLEQFTQTGQSPPSNKPSDARTSPAAPPTRTFQERR